MAILRFILTMVYDSSIEKIDYIYGSETGTCPISGESEYIPYVSIYDLYLDVALKNGYSIDTVTLGTVVGNRITIAAENISINATLECTITTKQSAPTLTFKHFYDAGTIGSGTVKFRHYSQQEPSSGETWVLNESPSKPSSKIDLDINFTSNDTNFSHILIANETGVWRVQGITYGVDVGSGTLVYGSINGWSNTAYRTLILDTPPTGDLLAWLQANGTKQGGVTLINFTIDGTTYQAEEGMTWQEWVNSSYNTYGCTIEGSSVKGKGNNGSPTYIYINQNLNLTLVSSTDSIIKNATYEDAAGGAGN